MHVIIGDREVELTESNGRYQATFTATENTDSVLIPSDCLGTLNVNDIQLEQGSQATPFVEPAVHAEDMSGIFKDLHELRIDIKDTDKDLRHEIKINQDGFEQAISNLEEGLNSRITSTADTFQANLKDTKSDLESTITQTAQTWQAKLSDTERELQSTIQSKADSLVTLIEDTDSENFLKTEQLVNGLKTTVKGDLRSQRTQLENLISSSIESATGEQSTIWQTLNSHGRQISNAQGDISKVEQTVSGYSRRISDVEGKYSSIEQTVSGLNSEVNDPDGIVESRFRQLKGLIDARVTRGDVEGIIQNSGDAIIAGLKGKGGDMMTELNLAPSGARLSGEHIFLDSNVTWTRDFRTRFASVIELRADQITSGEIDASRIGVINIDAGNITGQSARFLSAVFPNMNTYATIDDRGIMITGSDEWRRSHFNHVGIELYNGSGAYNKAGVFSYFKPNTDVADEHENVMERGGSRHSIGIGVSESHDLTLGWTNTRANSQIHSPAMTFNSEHKRIELESSLNAPRSTQGIRLNSEQHRGEFGIQLRWNNNFRSRLVLADNTYLEARNQIHFYNYSGSRAFSMGQNNDSWRNINMHSNQITNVSDRRKKRDILPTKLDSLSAIKNWKIVDFNWKDNEMNTRHGRQIGLIAQDTPELSFYDSDYDEWGINSSKQIMMNSHAIQQLSIQTEHQFNTHEEQLFKLQQELSKANRRIKELEELIA